MTRRFSLTRLCVFVFCLSLAGCNDDDEAAEADDPARYQLVNAIPDSPRLSITFEEIEDDDEDSDETSPTVNLVSFRDATTAFSTEEDEVEIRITYDDPETEDERELVETFTVSPVSGSTQVVMLSGTFESPEVDVYERQNEDFEDETDDDLAEVQVFNASSLDPGTVSLAGETDITLTLSPGSASAVQRISSEEDYDLILSDSAGATVFTVDSLTFTERSRTLVVLTNELDGTVSPLVVSEFGGTTTYTNDTLPLYLSILNGVPDELMLDITITDAFDSEASFTSGDQGFLDVSRPFEFGADTVFVDIDAVSGNANSQSVVGVGSATYELIVVGGQPGEIEVATAPLDPFPAATAVNLTAVNAADVTVLDDEGEEEPLAVSIYVLEPEENLGDADPEARSLAHLESRRFSSIATPSVIVATRTDSDEIVAGPVALEMEAGSSLIVVVGETVGGGLPLELKILPVLPVDDD